jgi:uncharacterized protein (UPF0332 family)
MKEDDISILVNYRMEQAKIAADDAKYLIDGNRSPQSIVNRSYYAMFYAVSALLQLTGNVPSKHSGTIALFDSEFVKKNIFPKELSKNLHKAFEQRQAFDYKIVEKLTEERARDIWLKSVEFVDAVQAYLSTLNL